jgi:UDP-glucose 4-epimerase
MRDELVIPQFVRRALDGEPLMINGGGSQFRNYVYVLDLADAHLRALRPAARNEVFNLEGREKVTVQNLADAVRTLIGDQVVIEHRASRAGDYEGKAVSADKALELLGWRASTSFADGLARYIEWYTSNRASGA